MLKKIKLHRSYSNNNRARARARKAIGKVMVDDILIDYLMVSELNSSRIYSVVLHFAIRFAHRARCVRPALCYVPLLHGVRSTLDIVCEFLLVLNINFIITR